MLASFVLRLDPARAADGVLAGQVEDVDTGTTAVIRGCADLIAFCAQRAATTGEASAPEPLPSRGES